MDGDTLTTLVIPYNLHPEIFHVVTGLITFMTQANLLPQTHIILTHHRNVSLER